MEGSQNVLKMESARKAHYTMAAVDCEPLGISLYHRSMTEPVSVHGLFHQKDIVQLCNCIPDSADKPNLSEALECQLQYHEEEVHIQPTDLPIAPEIVLPTIRQAVNASFLPRLLEKNGPYEEPTSELLRCMNYDFRQAPSLLHAVAQLHTGAIIFDKGIVFAITAEAYCRGKAPDVHGEASLKTFPTPSTCLYGSLALGIFEESDGKGMKNKMKIGSKTMNVLITLSAQIQKDSSNAINIGPESMSTTFAYNPQTARILYRQENVKRFMDVIKNDAKAFSSPKNISSLRQLTSGFHDSSTYLSARATHAEFDVERLTPATLFTVCDLPHNQGHGSSASSTGKLASRFIQALALSVMNPCHVSFVSAIDAFTTANSYSTAKTATAKSWAKLSAFVDKLTASLDEQSQQNPLVLASKVSFNDVADAGKAAGSANQKARRMSRRN